MVKKIRFNEFEQRSDADKIIYFELPTRTSKCFNNLSVYLHLYKSALYWDMKLHFSDSSTSSSFSIFLIDICLLSANLGFILCNGIHAVVKM